MASFKHKTHLKILDEELFFLDISTVSLVFFYEHSAVFFVLLTHHSLKLRERKGYINKLSMSDYVPLRESRLDGYH